MEVNVPQRFYDERGLERGEFGVRMRCRAWMYRGAWVREVIAGETLTRERMSSVELARNKVPAQP